MDGWSLLRLTPTGGVDRVVELPAQKTCHPAFGDTDMHTLFVISISVGLDLDDPRHAEAGNLWAVDVDVQVVAVGAVDIGATCRTSMRSDFSRGCSPTVAITSIEIICRARDDRGTQGHQEKASEPCVEYREVIA